MDTFPADGKQEADRGFQYERRSFDRLLVPFSARCLNAPLDQLDGEIKRGLEAVQSFFGGDRVLLWEFSEDGKQAHLAHSYAEAGTELPARTFQREALPYFFDSIRDHKNLCISRLEDLPQDAEIDRQYLVHSGIRSLLAIPLRVGSKLRGALSLACIRSERTWSNEDLFNFQRIGTILSGALDRKWSHQVLTRRMRFETIITDLSARLIKAPMDQVDGEIERSLAQVREIFQADNLGMLGISDDRRYCWISHSCYGDSGERIPADINIADLFPWSYDRLIMQGRTVILSCREDLPPEAKAERDTWLAMGVQAALNVPLFVEGRVAAAIVINSVSTPRTWPEEFVPRLQLLGEIFVNALERRKADAALQESRKQLQARIEEIEQLKQKVEQENIYLREEASLLFEHGDIVCQSAAMKSVLSQVERVSGTDSTVLITGETGTGKELLAREIHALSPRKARPLVTVNCASLPSTLIESELFGREKGAYTGALTRMAGRFEVADGSTIFLDEIAELPLDLQGKLLRIIEEGTFERLGSTKTIHVNARIIAATNRDLSQEVRRGAFRRDLFYRLNVFPISTPPLRERVEDIPPLVWAFVRQFEKKMGKQIESISQRSMEALKSYSWPGNVRELRNVIEHAMIVTRGRTLVVARPAVESAGQTDTDTGDLALETAERKHILAALQKCGWRIQGTGGAAEALGIKRTTLQSRMKKLGIERPSN